VLSLVGCSPMLAYPDACRSHSLDHLLALCYAVHGSWEHDSCHAASSAMLLPYNCWRELLNLCGIMCRLSLLTAK
jgi:hypothetical protein